MFTGFFYHLRASGLKVSLNEWMSLLEAMRQGLHDSSLTGFYYLARMLLVKSESDFDRFDRAFLEFFKDVKSFEELPQEAQDYVAFIEDLAHTRVTFIGVGAGREQIINRFWK